MKNNGVPFVVKFITFEFTRLLDISGQYHPSFKVADALVIARNNNLQLVCFNRADEKNLAFCKIIDYNKWQYQEEKRRKKQQLENRKETKEIRLSPNIAENDIEHKMRQANEFLEDGDEVILTMKLKGRDRLYMNEAEIRMNEILKKCDVGREIARKKGDNLIIVRLAKAGKNNQPNKVEKIETKQEVNNSNCSSKVLS